MDLRSDSEAEKGYCIPIPTVQGNARFVLVVIGKNDIETGIWNLSEMIKVKYVPVLRSTVVPYFEYRLPYLDYSVKGNISNCHGLSKIISAIHKGHNNPVSFC